MNRYIAHCSLAVVAQQLQLKLHYYRYSNSVYLISEVIAFSDSVWMDKICSARDGNIDDIKGNLIFAGCIPYRISFPLRENFIFLCPYHLFFLVSFPTGSHLFWHCFIRASLITYFNQCVKIFIQFKVKPPFKHANYYSK